MTQMLDYPAKSLKQLPKNVSVMDTLKRIKSIKCEQRKRKYKGEPMETLEPKITINEIKANPTKRNLSKDVLTSTMEGKDHCTGL